MHKRYLIPVVVGLLAYTGNSKISGEEIPLKVINYSDYPLEAPVIIPIKKLKEQNIKCEEISLYISGKKVPVLVDEDGLYFMAFASGNSINKYFITNDKMKSYRVKSDLKVSKAEISNSYFTINFNGIDASLRLRKNGKLIVKFAEYGDWLSLSPPGEEDPNYIPYNSLTFSSNEIKIREGEGAVSLKYTKRLRIKGVKEGLILEEKWVLFAKSPILLYEISLTNPSSIPFFQPQVFPGQGPTGLVGHRGWGGRIEFGEALGGDKVFVWHPPMLLGNPSLKLPSSQGGIQTVPIKHRQLGLYAHTDCAEEPWWIIASSPDRKNRVGLGVVPVGWQFNTTLMEFGIDSRKLGLTFFKEGAYRGVLKPKETWKFACLFIVDEFPQKIDGEKIRRLARSYGRMAVYLKDEVIKAPRLDRLPKIVLDPDVWIVKEAEVFKKGKNLLLLKNGAIFLPLRMTSYRNSPPYPGGPPAPPSANTSFRIEVEEIQPGSKVKVKIGKERFSFFAKKGKYTHQLKGELDGLHIAVDGYVGIKRIDISPYPDKIILAEPQNRATVSKVALCFSFYNTGDERYVIEISKDEKFKKIFKTFNIEARLLPPGKSMWPNVGISRVYFFPPEDIFSEGMYYWRVKTAKDSRKISETRCVKVTTKFEPKPLPKIFTSGKPIFSLDKVVLEDIDIEKRAFKFLEIENFHNSLPSSIKPYSLLFIGEPNEKVLQSAEEKNVPLAVQFYTCPYGASFEYIENILKKYSCIKAVILTEAQAQVPELVGRMLKLCAQYGRAAVTILPSIAFHPWMEAYYNEKVWKTIKKYGKYWVPVGKFIVPWTYLCQYSSLLGLWLTDVVDIYGHNPEIWSWSGHGFGKLGEHWVVNFTAIQNMPESHFGIMILMSIIQGGRYIQLEYPWGEGSRYWKKAIEPLFREIIEADLLPTKEEIRKMVKVGLIWDENRGDLYWRRDYGNFKTLFEGIRALGEPAYHDVVPNTGRYFIVPFFPPDTPLEKLREIGIKGLVTTESFRDRLCYREFFNQFYPEQNWGDAFITKIGDRIFIIQPHENKDVNIDFDIPLDNTIAKRIEGYIGPEAYITIKQYPDRLRIHCYGMEDRFTEINIHSDKELLVDSITRPNSLIKSLWRDGKLNLKISHKEGAVTIILKEK